MPMGRDHAVKVAKQFAFIGYQITRLHPPIISSLAQAEMKYEPSEYCALSLLSALYQGAMTAVAIGIALYLLKNTGLMYMAVGFGLVVAGFMFMRSMVYPSYLVRKRVIEIEKNFLYALRHMLIQVKGGTPVFNSMVSVSEAGYGEISNEFLRVVREINSGKSMTDTLGEMALRNPSIYLRRMIWQMVNALRTEAIWERRLV